MSLQEPHTLWSLCSNRTFPVRGDNRPYVTQRGDSCCEKLIQHQVLNCSVQQTSDLQGNMHSTSCRHQTHAAPAGPPCLAAETLAAGSDAAKAASSSRASLKLSGSAVGAASTSFSSSGCHVHNSVEGSPVPVSPSPPSDPGSAETVHIKAQRVPTEPEIPATNARPHASPCL